MGEEALAFVRSALSAKPNVIFTDHARLRIAQRGLDEGLLIKCLRTQKGLYHAEANPGGRSRYSAYFKLSNRYSLKSVMNIKRGELIVVTVIKIDTKKQRKVAKLAKRKRY